MKRILIILLVCYAGLASAQFDKNDITASVGTSIGIIRPNVTFGYSTSFIPPITFKVETGLFKNNNNYWMELISIGGYSNIYFSRSKNNLFYDNYRFFDLGAVGSYHITPILQDYANWGSQFDKLDIYVSVYSGLRFQKYSYNYNDIYFNSNLFIWQDNYVEAEQTKVLARMGGITGARYYFKENLAVYGEVGYGNPGYFTVGLSMKL